MSAREGLSEARMQICRTCLEEKPIGDFWKQPVRKDGRQTECRYCMRLRNIKWHAENKERSLSLNKKAVSKYRSSDNVRALLKSAKDRARTAGMKFSLLAQDILIPKFCPVLGIELTYGLGRGMGQSLEIRDSRASIDRIDNSKGYTAGNIVIVSYRANRIKSDACVDELKRIYEYYRSLLDDA